jgi:hypothetical protein
MRGFSRFVSNPREKLDHVAGSGLVRPKKTSLTFSRTRGMLADHRDQPFGWSEALSPERRRPQ